MSSEKQSEISIQPSEVSKFYQGKSLFITGAAGFLGAILLETLLRCCPEIRRIYILLRWKKGVQPEDRKASIFKKEIFWKIREKNPDVLKKVVVISGDVTQEDLGMNADDLRKITQEVSIVFHCAASVSFLKSLTFMMQQNTLGTSNIIELCRKLNKLDVLVYTSTAYSNLNIKSIDEKIYKLPFTAEEALEVLKGGSDEELMTLFSKCNPKFPNFYAFSKCLSENLLAEKAWDLPVSIVRPSIIINIWKGVIPGYVEEGSGMVNLCIGIGKGFIRVLLADSEKKIDVIPVDIVANTHIVAGYNQVSERLPSPSVYNCISSEFSSLTWGEYIESLFQMVLKYPLPKSYQKPGLTVCSTSVKYWVFSVLDHYAPAVVIDVLLWLSGRKPRLFKLYRFYDRTVNSLQHFTMNEWNFKCENLKSLAKKLNTTDADMFPVDLTDFTFKEITRSTPTGSPVYQSNNDNKSPEERLRVTYMRYYLTSCIKWTLLGCIASAFYVVFF